MPGFGLGLGLGLAQQLRLDQRLEQRLEQCLKMTLLESVDTQGGHDAAHELLVVKAILKDLDGGLYKSPEEFVERIGKRVPKLKRTEGTREIVAALRSIVETMKFSLEGIRSIVAAAITVGERMPISGELSALAKIVSSPSVPVAEWRELVFVLWKTGAVCEEGYLNFLPLFSEACEELALEPAAFVELLRPFVGNEQLLRPRFVDAVQRNFDDVVEHQTKPEAVALAVELLLAHEHLLGHLNTAPPVNSIRRLIAEQSDWPNSLPFIFRLTALGENSETRSRLAEFCAEESFGHEVDRQRRILAAGLLLDSPRHLGFFARLIALSGNSRELSELCQAVTHVLRGGYSLGLSNSTSDFASALSELRNEAASAFARLPFGDGYRSRLAVDLDRIPQGVLDPAVSLAGIYEKTYPDGLPLLARLVEHVLDRDFQIWRYGHEVAAVQLKPVKACRAWQDNWSRSRILGRRDEISTRLAALRLLFEEARVAFSLMFNREWTEGLAAAIEVELQSMSERFRSPDLDPLAKKALGQQKTRLHSIYKASRMIELFGAAETDLGMALSVFKERLHEFWISDLREPVEKAVAILESAGFSGDRVLRITETDHPIHTLNVGTTPVKSCQRWTEETGHNQCLLAYVLDPNKKVWQFSTRLDACVGRAVVRLLPFKKSALLLLEPPYSVRWSDDHTTAFVLTVLEKAGAISREIGKPVYVGFVGDRKRGGEYLQTFEAVAEELKGKLKVETVDLTLPPSLNKREYSDALGGDLASGAVLSDKPITYLTVDTAAEDEAG